MSARGRGPARTDFIDSSAASAFGAFTGACMYARSSSYGPGELQRIFEYTGMDRILRFVDTLEAPYARIR
jgi:hypothetical protein